MITDEIRARLIQDREEPFAAFQYKLIPTLEKDAVLGVRTPALRQYARELKDRADLSLFFDALPHRFFDENQLHAFLLSQMTDYARLMPLLKAFLPYVDNWATCDQLSPVCFRKHREELLPEIEAWLRSDRLYTVRFGLGALMAHYLDDAFRPAFHEMAAAVRYDAYYVRMMVAWYFATALAKQYDATLPYLLDRRLEPRTHNKAIQKAVESRRLTPEQKEYLKSLRRR